MQSRTILIFKNNISISQPLLLCVPVKPDRVDKTMSAVLTQTSRAGIGVQFFRWIIASK